MLAVPVCAQAQELKTVSEPFRILDGIGEWLSIAYNFFIIRKNYPECSSVCGMPDFGDTYVPQGFCYIASRDMFAVTAYSTDDNENSAVALVDAKTGDVIKTVKLLYEDGSKCRAHAGGIADIGEYVIISTGKSVRRLKIDDILSAENLSEIKFSGQLKTDMQASYICSYENELFVGQYYSFTPQGTYDTPPEQRLWVSKTERNYAMCERIDLSDIDAAFENGTAQPEAVYSMPNAVQGIAFDGKTFAMTTSCTPVVMSHLICYDLENREPDGTFNMNGKEVPLYFMKKEIRTSDILLPPMAEGIDYRNGSLTGIFESGAKKFSYSRIKINDICVFG